MGLGRRSLGILGAAAGLLMMAGTSTAGAAPAVVDFDRAVNRNSGLCLEVENSSTANGARVQQWSCSSRRGDDWYPVRQSNGLYKIVNKNSGKCLEVENSNGYNGARVQQWSCVGQEGALWAFFWQSNTQSSEIVSWTSNRCLEIENSSRSNGARAQLWDCVGQPGIRWSLPYDV